MFIKKINKEEKQQLALRPIGKKHPVRAAIEAMEVGDILRVSRAAFRWKGQSPKLFTNAISRDTEKLFEVNIILDNSGWVVEREA